MNDVNKPYNPHFNIFHALLSALSIRILTSIASSNWIACEARSAEARLFCVCVDKIMRARIQALVMVKMNVNEFIDSLTNYFNFFANNSIIVANRQFVQIRSSFEGICVMSSSSSASSKNSLNSCSEIGN